MIFPYNFIYFLQRNAFAFVALSFILVGLGLAAVFYMYDLPNDAKGWIMNIATEFSGGVMLIIAFAALQTRFQRRDGLDYRRLSSDIRTAKRKIRIMTTFTYLFSSPDRVGAGIDRDLIKLAREELDKKAQYSNAIEIEILVLNPMGDGARARAADRPDTDVIGNLDDNIRNLHDWVQQFSSRRERGSCFVSVRVYDAVPRFTLIQCDRTLRVSFFEKGIPISKSKTSTFSEDQPISEFFIEHFNQFWNDAQTEPVDAFVDRTTTTKSVHIEDDGSADE